MRGRFRQAAFLCGPQRSLCRTRHKNSHRRFGCRVLLEHCQGNLEDLVHIAKKQSRLPGLPPADTITLGLMLCSALTTINSARCLHLDVKPTNILLAHAAETSRSETESAHLRQPCSARLKFNQAKQLPLCAEVSISRNELRTKPAGRSAGTLGYASKEQILGQEWEGSDVYSLGGTLLFTSTGAHPFCGDSAELIIFKLCLGVCLLPRSA